MADTTQAGPGAAAKPGGAARLSELSNGLKDPSNVAGLMVIGSVLLLVALSKSFGGLTVSVP